MRYFVIVLVLLAAAIVPSQAQPCCFDQGVYEFEDNIAMMAYTSGTWITGTIYGGISSDARATSSAGGSVSFRVDGQAVVIWRIIYRSTLSSRMDVCVNASCIAVNNESTSGVSVVSPFFLTVAPGDVITITQTLGTISLDSFMVLEDPVTGAMPTAVPTVPTATILPSSTPAYTATPGDTPVPTATIVPSSTPAPTATPYTLPAAIWAIDPASKYDSTNGQITKQTYGMAAPDYMTLFILAALLVVNLLQLGLTVWKRK